VLLRHQYRCHPALSRIPNELYYGGRLLNGCSEEQRAELVLGLPPLTFVNVKYASLAHRQSDQLTHEKRYLSFRVGHRLHCIALHCIAGCVAFKPTALHR